MLERQEENTEQKPHNISQDISNLLPDDVKNIIAGLSPENQEVI